MNKGSLGFPGTGDSCISVGVANGYGSVSNKHRRFSQIFLSIGDDVVYEDNASFGATFRIATAGKYGMVYCDNATAAANIGISLDSTQGATGVTLITPATRLCVSTTGNAGYNGEATAIRWLPAGAIIRPHSDGLAISDPNTAVFTITKL